MLPSKIRPTTCRFLSTTGTAGVAADDVVGADEVDGLAEVELVALLQPQPRQVERVFVLELDVARVQAVERGAVRRDGPVERVAGDATVAESQGHRGVGADLVAVAREQRATDQTCSARPLVPSELLVELAALDSRSSGSHHARRDDRDDRSRLGHRVGAAVAAARLGVVAASDFALRRCAALRSRDRCCPARRLEVRIVSQRATAARAAGD